MIDGGEHLEGAVMIGRVERERNGTEHKRGRRYRASPHHALMFGAIAATACGCASATDDEPESTTTQEARLATPRPPSGGSPERSVRLRCGHDEQICGDHCANFARDALNCGRCGARCAEGERCAAGRCEEPSAYGSARRPSLDRLGRPLATVGCARGETRCSEGCVDLEQNARACGTCGRICARGSLCASGRCVTREAWLATRAVAR